MKWTTRILFVLAISISTAVIAMVSNQRNRTPELSLDAIEETLEKDDYNHSTLIQALNTAFKNSQRAGDQDSQIRALTIRGDLYLEIGAHEEARNDFEQIKALLPIPDARILLRLVQTDIKSGDPERGQRRIDELLKIAPNSSKAYTQRGRLHLTSARQRQTQCESLLKDALAPAQFAIGVRLLDQLSAQDLMDPERAGGVSSLRELFPEAAGEKLSRILVLADEASSYSRDARASFERSFAFDAGAEAIYEFINLLMRSKQPEKAMRFGAQARMHEEIKGHHKTTLSLIKAHYDARDINGAGTLAAELVQATRELTTQEYALCCKALLASERWSGLFFAASRMRAIGTSVDGLESSLYLGLAQNGRKRHANARTLLRSFAKSNLIDPYPDAHYHAWTILAGLDRAAEEPFFERESVHAALKLAPPGEESKELWVRLGELQLEDGHTNPALPLRSFAEAICQSKRIEPELFERYLEIGKKTQASEGRDLDLVYQELVRERRSLPPIPLNSYELLGLAKKHATSGNNLAVISVCRRLLDNLPGFLPATNMMINARLALGRERSAIAQIVDRMDSTGLDELSMQFIQRLPRDPFTTAQLHRVMKADPTWTGKLETARRLRAVGDRRAALACLQSNESEISSEEALLSATILAELGERDAAKEKLAGIQASSPSYPQAMLLWARLGSLTNDTAVIDAAVDAVLATEDVQVIQSLVEQLIFDRRLERVTPALVTLAELSGESDPWVLEQYVLYRLVRGETDKARESASRAEYFSLSHKAPLGMILASTITADRAQAAADAALFLKQFPHALNNIAKAATSLLAQKPDLAKEIIDSKSMNKEKAPEWTLITVAAEALGHDIGMAALSDEEIAYARGLLLGTSEQPRDPITSLGVILAAQTSFYAPYALEKLNEYAGQERDAWSTFLIANTLKRGNELGRARDTIWSFTQADAEYFGPAWDLQEGLEYARLGTLDHPEIEALRLSRLKSEARGSIDSSAALLTQAYEALKSGDLSAATEACSSALEIAPLDHQANAAMAHVKYAGGDHRVSLNHWISACENAPSTYLPGYVSKSLEVIEKALAFTPPKLLSSDAAGALETISTYAKRDPRIPLLMAKLDLQKDPDNPAMGVTRAFRRLQNYIAQNPKLGIADLLPGAEVAWAHFYGQHGPEQALNFCRQQLLLSPGAYSLWIAEVRALRDLGQTAEALEAAHTLLKINATAEVYEEIAACLQESGATVKAIEAELAKAYEVNSGSLSVAAMLTRTKSLLSVRGERAASQSISLLTRIWDTETTGAIENEQAEVGLILAEGFMKRDKKGDRNSAKLLLAEVSERGTDPYARSLAFALAGLCEQK